ncbi:MAG: HAMP domain-containing histidine kinase [Actinomycetota bacterium]|nr:HAMP domain-containing histidine kinase [Actinomycetota bacterium]
MRGVPARLPRRLRHVTVRVKLTVGFVLAMSVVLGATGLFLYLRFASELDRAIDRGLRSQVGAVQTLIAQTDSGLRESGRGLSSRSQGFAQVLRDGLVIDYTIPLSRPLLKAGLLTRATRGTVMLKRRTVPGIDQPVRLLASPVVGQDGHREVAVVGTRLADRNRALGVLATLLTLGGAGALLLAGAVGYLLSTFALRSVESMRRRAQTLSLTDRGGRLPVPRAHDELWKLGTTLNEMLARNEAAFSRERAFVADVSHELRTPLTILRAELEIALRAGTETAELREAMASAAEEAERLSRLADDLLLLARADQGMLPVRAASLPAQDLLARVAERFRPRAAREHRGVSIECRPDTRVTADPEWVERALANMLENALLHGVGQITLSVSRTSGAVDLHVRDEGAGFPPGFLDSAFERFTRAERGRTSEGSGIGLSLVQSIALAHGGRAHAENRRGGGADVWISLPLAAETAEMNAG